MKNQLQSPESTLSALESFFPLNSIEAVVALFRHMVLEAKHTPPNLALVSIMLGFFETETYLQQQQQASKEASEGSDGPVKDGGEEEKDEEKKEVLNEEAEIPVLTFQRAQDLYQQFVSLVTDQLAEFCGSAESDEKKAASREMIKAISDLLWKQLFRNYQKEKTHIQFLYSFLTGEGMPVTCAEVACR